MSTLTVPEITRQWTQRAEEFKRINAEYTRDGREPTAEESARLNEMYAEISNQGKYAKMMESAEQAAYADSVIAKGRESAGRVTSPLAHQDVNNTKGKHQYSMLKAIREAAGWGSKEGTFGQFGLTGLEAEVDADLRKQRAEAGLKTRGIAIPNTLPVDAYASRRYGQMNGMQAGGSDSYAYTSTDLATTVESTLTGAGAIPLTLGTMIDILRTRTVLASLGVRFMTGLQGNFALPRQATTTTAYWVNEGQDVTQSAATIDQVLLSPHTVGVRSVYTRRFLEQTSVDAEAFIREDQGAVKAREIERVAFNGTGSGGQPLGVFQNPLVPLIAAGTNGAAPSYANIVALETSLAALNVEDDGTMGYVIDATVRGLLKTTPKIGSTFPTYLWDGGATPLNGYKVAVTNLLPSNFTHGSGSNLHAMIFGRWSDMIVATWGSDDVIVNPYSADASGSVIITSFSDVDVEIRHPESFVKMLDILTS